MTDKQEECQDTAIVKANDATPNETISDTEILITTDFGPNIKITTFFKANGVESFVVVPTGSLVMYNTNIYKFPISNKTASVLKNPIITVNPSLAHLFDVKSVIDGFAIVEPLINGYVITDDVIIAILVNS